jgi:hypothetical protein
MKLYAMCLSSGYLIQTGNTVCDAVLYSLGYLWVWVITVLLSMLTAYNRSLCYIHTQPNSLTCLLRHQVLSLKGSLWSWCWMQANRCKQILRMSDRELMLKDMASYPVPQMSNEKMKLSQIGYMVCRQSFWTQDLDNTKQPCYPLDHHVQ